MFVLCSNLTKPEKGKSISEITFPQIIDPDTLTNLGTTLKCSVVDVNENLIEHYSVKVKDIEKIIPPQWVPIPNDNIIDVNSGDRFRVNVTDRRLGRICFYTKTIEIQGVDVRIYGNEINYSDEDKTIAVAPLLENGKSKYLLSIKGSRLKVTNIRTVDIEEIQIVAYDKFGICLKDEELKPTQKTSNSKDIKWYKSFWVWASLLSFLACLVLPFIPVWNFEKICNSYINVIPRDSQIKEISLSQENTNTFSVTINCGSSKTNIVMQLPNLATFKPQKRLSLEKPIGAGGVTFYFVGTCLLYVALYVFVVGWTLYALRSLKHYNKLNGNMSSVIEALRNERDKEKRKAMQRKILDDMINTYLGKPSSED